MGEPDWFGLRYPTLDDLEDFAEQLGAAVIRTRGGSPCFWPGSEDIAPALLIPCRAGPLEQVWTLGHELGHLVQHFGPKGELNWARGEAQANRWAASALIPEARITAYGNACEDAMVAALSAHYEDLPLIDCDARRLAGKIAHIRLRTLEEVA